ncbi:hypothetical protein, partial [Pluralibacter gergoviae]|uniref:hypothetical protein n=1 Tax=Pluralibacter gergoviae TaxID=61647 RepID=UPI001F198756
VPVVASARNNLKTRTSLRSVSTLRGENQIAAEQHSNSEGVISKAHCSYIVRYFTNDRDILLIKLIDKRLREQEFNTGSDVR